MPRTTPRRTQERRKNAENAGERSCVFFSVFCVLGERRNADENAERRKRNQKQQILKRVFLNI